LSFDKCVDFLEGPNNSHQYEGVFFSQVEQHTLWTFQCESTHLVAIPLQCRNWCESSEFHSATRKFAPIFGYSHSYYV
jgi:hypothetical protein